MGQHNSRLVKIIGGVCLVALLILFFSQIPPDVLNRRGNESDDSFKPMIKVDDDIYIWEEEFDHFDTSKYELIGKVAFSYEDTSKTLGPEDVSLSSNLFPKNSKIYRYDDKRILVEFEPYGFTILKKTD
ncbi:hypothetical protein [Kallipyga gabonensis]|uniref:hypothetical protein n=1 Tax=Kallipyga gabonensis TaxID=1686287 RepID=UPI0006B5AEE2|nr:hypothetical protein [Kallipyga gabonensis]